MYAHKLLQCMDRIYKQLSLPEYPEQYEPALEKFRGSTAFAFIKHKRLTFKDIAEEVLYHVKQSRCDKQIAYEKYLRSYAAHIYFRPKDGQSWNNIIPQKLVTRPPEWVPIREVGLTAKQASYRPKYCEKRNGRWWVNKSGMKRAHLWVRYFKALEHQKPPERPMYDNVQKFDKYTVLPCHLGDVYVFKEGEDYECRKCDNGWRCNDNCRTYAKEYFVVPSKGLVFEQDYHGYKVVGYHGIGMGCPAIRTSP